MRVGQKFSVARCAKFSRAWRGEFGNETAQQSKRGKFSVASVCGQNSARLHDKFSLASVAKWAVLAGEVGKAKMGQCLGGGLLSLSLSLSLSLVSTRLLKHKTPFYTQKFNLLKFLLKNTLNLSNFSHLYRLRGQNNALYFCYKFLKNLALKEVQG